MSRKKSAMSEHMKYALAKDLGFADKVEERGWASITTGEAGSMVKRAVEVAGEQMANREIQTPKPDRKDGHKDLDSPKSSPGKPST